MEDKYAGLLEGHCEDATSILALNATHPRILVYRTRNVGTIWNANIIGQAKILSPAPYRSSDPDVNSSVRGHGFVEGGRGRLGEVVIHTFMSTARLTCSSCLENGRQQGRRSPTNPGLDVLQRAQN